MADLLYNPDTFLPTFYFPHKEFNERVSALITEITEGVASDAIRIPGSVVAGGKVKEHIRQMAKDKANEEFATQREKADLATRQIQEYYELRMKQVLEGMPAALAKFIKRKAWDDGHSSGFGEVVNIAECLTDDLGDFGTDLVLFFNRMDESIRTGTSTAKLKQELGAILAGGKDLPITLD